MPIEKLLYEEEGATLDFKREQYKFSLAGEHQKSELLKDVLAFSNAWRRVDAYILIGVEEIKGGRSKPIGIHDALDDAQLQQFINSKTQRPIEFQYSTVLLDDVKIGVIRVPVQTRPFYLKNDYGNLKKNSVYIRRGSSTDEASPEEVRDMGRSEKQDSQEIPDLTLIVQSLNAPSKYHIEDSEWKYTSRIRVSISSLGRRVARDVLALLKFPDKSMVLLNTGYRSSLQNISDIQDVNQALQYDGGRNAFHPGMNTVIGEVTVLLSEQLIKNVIDTPLVEWTLFADEMEPKQGNVTLESLGWKMPLNNDVFN